MYISDIIEKQLLVKTKILITFLYVFYTCYKMTAIKTIRNYTNRNFIIVTEYIFNYICVLIKGCCMSPWV